MTMLPRTDSKRVLSLCVIVVVMLWAGREVFAALPADPNNAAFVYYQAALEMEVSEPEFPGEALNALVINGIEGDVGPLRDYLKKGPGRYIVALVENGTRMPYCDWGLKYSGWFPRRFNLPLLRLSYLVYAKACFQAADGQYRDALETCLLLRRFAAHVGDSTHMQLLVSLMVDTNAIKAAKHVVAGMPDDAEELKWFKQEWNSLPGPSWRPKVAWKRFAELRLEYWRAWPHNDEHDYDRNKFLEVIEDETVREEVRRLSDKELLERAEKSFDAFLAEAVTIMDSDRSMTEQCRLLCLLEARYEEAFKKGDAIFLIRDMMSSLCRAHEEAWCHYLLVSRTWQCALDVYIVKAQTGRFPEALPQNASENPCNGQAFEYEITEMGFLLRGQNVPTVRNETTAIEIEFTVQK